MNRASLREALSQYDALTPQREDLRARYGLAFKHSDYASVDEDAADLNERLVDVLDSLVSAIREEGE